MVTIKAKQFFVFSLLPIITLILVFVFQGVPSIKAAGIFTITPATGTLINNCTATATIAISVPSGESNAADIIIHYDTTKIEILDSVPAFPGIQILQGNAFESYAGNIVDSIAGTIKLVGYSTSSTLSSTATFATIKFKPKPLVASGAFTIEFTGADPYNTLDSNVADVLTSFDMLQSVSNASYTFVSGSCTSDTTPPNIINTYPANGSTGIPSSAAVSITITDSSSGVDLSSIEVIINGESYVFGDPEVSITGTPSSYTIDIIPRTAFPSEGASVITTKASDLSGNSTNKSISFNAPATTCPAEKTVYVNKECTTEVTTTPTPELTPTKVPTPESPTIVVTDEPTLFIAGWTEIVFTITDDTGIAPDTFILNLGGKVFSLGTSPDKIQIDGNKMKYTFTVQIQGSELERTAEGDIIGYVRISDIDGNTRIENITFKGPNNGSIQSNSTNGFQELLRSPPMISAAALLSVLALFSTFLSIQPTIAIAYNGRTGKRIPFPKAYIRSHGKRSIRLSSIRGRITGRIPTNGGTLTIQKYGYKSQEIILIGNEKDISVSLTKI